MQARRLELKELNDGKFTYRAVMTVVLTQAVNPQIGITMGEIRQCNKILDKIEVANGSVLLSEEEWGFLKHRVEIFPFGMGGRALQQMADDIAEAPRVEVTAP